VIRVLVVDDHAFVRLGVCMLLEQADGIVVVGECTDGEQVAGAAQRLHPDVVLMDLRMPRISGLDATRDLLRLLPDVRVLVLTAAAGGGLVERARRAGAVGCVFKGGAAEDMVSAVRTVAAGRTAWPSDPLGVSAGPGW